jgi:phosphatidylglycerophosphate synthase
LTLGAGLSFLALLWLARGRFTHDGAFGVANCITSLRLALVLCLPVLPSEAVGPAALLILALDGLDGAIARRLGQSSAFGAHFDMETDAVFVAQVSLALWARGLTGAWVLSSGALRYLYVVSVWLVPARGGEAPRARWGRYSFLVLVLGLIAPWLLGARLGAPFAGFGCAVVAFSFARSFAYSYRLLT